MAWCYHEDCYKSDRMDNRTRQVQDRQRSDCTIGIIIVTPLLGSWHKLSITIGFCYDTCFRALFYDIPLRVRLDFEAQPVHNCRILRRRASGPVLRHIVHAYYLISPVNPFCYTALPIVHSKRPSCVFYWRRKEPHRQ